MEDLTARDAATFGARKGKAVRHSPDTFATFDDGCTSFLRRITQVVRALAAACGQVYPTNLELGSLAKIGAQVETSRLCNGECLELAGPERLVALVRHESVETTVH